MSIKTLALSTALITAGMIFPDTAHAGFDDYIGEISLVGYTFCPRGTAETNGQLLPISSNTALFSLIGTTYGGDGRTTFALPDLRSRAPLHVGQGQGLSLRQLGSRGGTETNIMTINEMPNHSHRAGIKSVNVPPNSNTPYTNSFTTLPGNAFVDGTLPDEVGAGNPRFMNPATIYVEPSGGGLPQNNMQPFLTMRYCIALQGIFPSRN